MMQREEILALIQSFPPLPNSLQKVLVCQGKPESDCADVVVDIQSDPIFHADILRLAKILRGSESLAADSIEQVIQQFGYSSFYSIALVAGMIRWFNRLKGKTEIVPKRLCDHCMAVGIGAETLVSVLDLPPVEYVFAAGYLHDFGKALMEKYLTIDSAGILEEAERLSLSVDQTERQLLGIDHMEIGATLLQRWNFPPPIVQAVRWHHLPDSVTDAPLVDIVHVADAMALMMGIGPVSEGLNYETSSAVKDRLNLKIGVIEEVICCIQDRFEAMQVPFSTLLGE